VRPLRAAHLGEVGFLEFVLELGRLGVLDSEEALAWLRLHGDVLRVSEPPLDRGDGVPDGLVEWLLREAAE
jgi:hypothetical protein